MSTDELAAERIAQRIGHPTTIESGVVYLTDRNAGRGLLELKSITEDADAICKVVTREYRFEGFRVVYQNLIRHWHHLDTFSNGRFRSYVRTPWKKRRPTPTEVFDFCAKLELLP